MYQESLAARIVESPWLTSFQGRKRSNSMNVAIAANESHPIVISAFTAASCYPMKNFGAKLIPPQPQSQCASSAADYYVPSA